MATKNIVPRADGEGEVGTSAKNWNKVKTKAMSLGGVERSTWPDPALTDVLNNGPVGNIPNGQEFELKDSTGVNSYFYVDEATGKTGFGTDSPSAKVEVREDQDSDTYVVVSNQNTGSSAVAGIQLSTANGLWNINANRNGGFGIDTPLLDNAFFINNSGDLGLQETTPSKALDIKNGAAGGDILCYDIYTHDGGVETSDERLKENIQTTNLGLDFINRLNPVGYKWKDVPAVIEPITELRQKMVSIEEEVTRAEIVKIDGKYILKVITETKAVDEPVFDEFPLYDEAGNILQELVSPEKAAVLDGNSKVIEPAQDAVYRDMVHRVPVMEEVTETKELYGEETYSRTHQGMIAQEVGQVLEEMGLTSQDFAGFVYEEDRDRFGLRYVEFIAPLIKAVQELTKEVDLLKS